MRYLTHGPGALGAKHKPTAEMRTEACAPSAGSARWTRTHWCRLRPAKGPTQQAHSRSRGLASRHAEASGGQQAANAPHWHSRRPSVTWTVTVMRLPSTSMASKWRGLAETSLHSRTSSCSAGDAWRRLQQGRVLIPSAESQDHVSHIGRAWWNTVYALGRGKSAHSGRAEPRIAPRHYSA